MQTSCKTYSAHWDDDHKPLFEGLPVKELFEKIPAGSRMISGNIVKAKYKRGCRTFTVHEDIKS